MRCHSTRRYSRPDLDRQTAASSQVWRRAWSGLTVERLGTYDRYSTKRMKDQQVAVTADDAGCIPARGKFEKFKAQSTACRATDRGDNRALTRTLVSRT